MEGMTERRATKAFFNALYKLLHEIRVDVRHFDDMVQAVENGADLRNSIH